MALVLMGRVALDRFLVHQDWLGSFFIFKSFRLWSWYFLCCPGSGEMQRQWFCVISGGFAPCPQTLSGSLSGIRLPSTHLHVLGGGLAGFAALQWSDRLDVLLLLLFFSVLLSFSVSA